MTVVPEVIPSEQTTMLVGDLTPHPDNPRRGDLAGIKESIKANGFFGRAVVQKSTGYILDGNHRVKAAAELGITSVPVDLVDVDDDTAKRILLVANRLNEKGTFDLEDLADLLASLVPVGLAGTGYTEDDVADIDALLEAAMPAPDDRVEEDQIHKHFNNEGQHTSNRRVFVFDLAMPTFEWADRQLRAVEEKYGLRGNTDVFLTMLEKETGEKQPVLDD